VNTWHWQRVENPWQELENTTAVFALNAWRGHLYLGTRNLHNGGEVLRSADGIHWHSIAAQVDLIPVCGSLAAGSVNAALPIGDEVCVLRGGEGGLSLCFHLAQKNPATTTSDARSTDRLPPANRTDTAVLLCIACWTTAAPSAQVARVRLRL